MLARLEFLVYICTIKITNTIQIHTTLLYYVRYRFYL